ncbi:acyl carrier protein [Methylocella silvestris]|uniref:Acyl carrier protein n=1 Tax=Methylocella silvestris TaxID=199596 RepID=A0A2J7TJI9_METSI|nr:acyl carrier protein [Methylocella silvestris]PNG26897.1 acyl carrier protein [Methylocella silvestris]
MQKPQIYSELNDIFRDLFDDDNIVLKPETSADDVDGWDSLAHINLIVAIEAKFKIKFKTAEIESLHNVEHLVDVIAAKLG